MTIIKEFDKSFSQRQKSYKMVTILAILENLTSEGNAEFEKVVESFRDFYLDRYKRGKKPEKDDAPMNDASVLNNSNLSRVKDTIGTPLERLSDFIEYDRETSQIRFHDQVFRELQQDNNIENLKKVAYKHLREYYKKLDNNWIALEDLKDLDYGYAVSADDISSLSGQNRVKGIHPIESQDYKSVIVLCTIGGQDYPNEWLDEKKYGLRYYLEGRKVNDKKEYNPNSKSNQAIIKSQDEKYPVLAFVRDNKNSLFYYEGEFVFHEIQEDDRGHSFFVLKRQSNSNNLRYKDAIDITKKSSSTREEVFDAYNLNQISEHVISYINNKGFIFTEEMIKNYLLSLKCKPFVILAGISGTGKSKLIELVANAIGATRENGRFKLIPVRPDWNDSTDLLGYKNLQGDFVEGELTKIIRQAHDDLNHPYFVCLDEMNLARVEYYFSDILSVMETRRLQDNRITSSFMPVEGLEEELTFPENMYIIGTVNMDETTHSFSRKVLDRANTIEFNEVKLNQFPEDTPNESLSPIIAHNDVFKTEYLTLKDCYLGNEEFIKNHVKLLESINEILKDTGLQVGYRVRDEFCFYLLNNYKYQLLDENIARDFQIMQKILPRIQGSSFGIGDVLENFINLCSHEYTYSKEKAEFMLGRFNDDGFTSYWV